MPCNIPQDLLNELDVLPELVREMVQVMGEKATLVLIGELGGRRLCVPGFPQRRRSIRFERLEGLLGTEAARAYAERWGDIELQVPRCTSVILLRRNREIAAAYSAGTQASDLAAQFGLSERHIFKILKQPV